MAEKYTNKFKRQMHKVRLQFQRLLLDDGQKKVGRPKHTGTVTHPSRPPPKPPFSVPTVNQANIRMSPRQIRELLKRQYRGI